jgi:hypothetical protein
VSEIQPEVDPVDPDLDDQEEDEDEDSEGEPVSAGRNYQDLPEGYLTLVGFSHLLAKPRKQGGRNTKVSSQVLYSTAKNTKAFPNETHVDGRQIINVEKGLQWWDDKEQRKQDRLTEAQAQANGEDEEDESITATS